MPANEATLQSAHVELRDISKSFGGTRALEGVSLSIGKGSIHALVGENGAGKSTLGKIIAGVHSPDAGQVWLGGEPARFHSPRDAIARKVIMIAQELSIVGSLSVAENVFLGVEPRTAGFTGRKELRRRYAELARSVGFDDLPGDASAGSLRTADQQRVEILRALSRNAELIVMDEPTAALSRPDVEALHAVVRQLAAGGTTVVLVSHFLTEVLQLADTVTILRDGHLVQTVPAAGQTEDTLLSAMLGRPLDAAFPARRPAPPDAPVVLSVRDLHAPGVNNVTFHLRAGEILGLAGLVGAGRSELARAIYRASKVSSGSVTVAQAAGPAKADPAEVTAEGMRKVSGDPRSAMRAGVLMIPESRKEQGLLLGRPVTENVSLASLAQVAAAGFVRAGQERRTVRGMLQRVDVRGGAGLAAPASTLSGGNQQKLLFARSLLRDPTVLIADEPTRGVDVGAKRAIYELLASLARAGVGVLVISSDIEEVLGLAHRVLVMRGGQVVAELTGDEATETAILSAAFGATESPGAAGSASGTSASGNGASDPSPSKDGD